MIKPFCMTKFFLFLLLVVAMATANAQTVINHRIFMGKTDSVKSIILNEKRQVWIYLPQGYDEKGFSKQRYPVVYLLDGDAHFASVTGMIQQLSEINGNMICPDMIVVAIPNTDRTRDLTPTRSLVGPDGKKIPGFETSGGNEKFISFIQKELMPHIDSNYATASYKMLIGHSFGGLTVMNIVVNHTDMFNAYVAIDPSMWWDNRKLLSQAHDVMKQKKFAGKSLYLAIANTMPMGMDTQKVRKDTSGATGHIRSILDLADILKANPDNGLKFAYKYYNEDNHGSVPLLAEYDALHFLFGFYKFPDDLGTKLYDPTAKIDVATIISKHYSDVSANFGYKILPPESEMNQLGYFYLQSNAPEKAYAMFNMNVQNYPKSGNVYDSMGDYYDNTKDKNKAIEFYTKALKISENKDTRDKLNKLMK